MAKSEEGLRFLVERFAQVSEDIYTTLEHPVQVRVEIEVTPDEFKKLRYFFPTVKDSDKEVEVDFEDSKFRIYYIS